MNAQYLLNLLKESGYIDQAQATQLLDDEVRSGKPITEVIANNGLYSEDELYEIIAHSLGTVYIPDISIYDFNPDLLSRVQAQAARQYGVFPILFHEGFLNVAVTEPLDPKITDGLQFALGCPHQVVIAKEKQILDYIQKYYPIAEEDMNGLLEQLAGEALEAESGAPSRDSTNLDAASSAPIIRYVNTVLAFAIQARASDIHFEPFEYEFRIRYRVDGALYEMAPPPMSLCGPVISRIKVMSSMNIAEKRVPQDGRIQTTIANRGVDLRVSTLPTQFGESVVLRILDRSSVNLDLEALNLPPKIYKYISETIQKPNGIFIVTGPTGAGKTTTLYACLRKINTEDAKILTAEDPVEYELEGIQQIAVKESIGLTFSRILRAFLRQDPDRIMVGEMRDLETAQIAIQASLTGHLVLTTLHTNDAAGAVSRLLDMNVEPFLISSSLEGVLAQRLVRKICSHCKTPYEPTESVLQQIGLSSYDIGDKVFYYGKGCENCNGTGYRGRKGIYELLDVSEPIRELINQKAPSVVIRQKAIELGMTTLRQDGLRNIFDGETTIEEILKYT